MKKNTNSRTSSKEHSGVILILVVGVLAIMSLLAVSFAVNMQLEQKAALNYINKLKAECVAEAGAQKALADIRKWAKEQPYSTLTGNIAANYPPLNTTEVEIEGVGTYLVRIQDESAKVNINALTNTDSAEIDKLYNDGKLSYNQIAAIIDYRDSDGAPTNQLYTSGGWESCQGGETNAKNSPFATIEEIKVIAGIDDDSYEDAEDYITVDRQIVRGGLMAKYYKPVTAAFSYPNDSYLGTVVELGELKSLTMSDVPGSESDEEAGDAQFGGGYLMNKKAGNDWLLNEFGVVYEGFIYILPTEIGSRSFSLDAGDSAARLYIDGQTVSGSHNFTYAGWHPIKIEYYDLSEENGLDFKWDSGDYVPSERLGYSPPITVDGVNYDNAGAYKIISTGAIEAADGSILAKRKTSAVVRVFGAWTVTTRSEFSAAWKNTQREVNENGDIVNSGDFSDGEINNVTWLDSCPTDEDTGTSWDGTGYGTISDSLKLGYWDNFGEDVAYSVVNVGALASEYMDGTGTLNDDGTGWTVSYNELSSNQLNIYCPIRTSRVAEVNRNYYFLSNSSIFARTWERDDGYNPDTGTYGHSPSKRNANPGGSFEPEPQMATANFSVKKDSTELTYNIFLGDASQPDYAHYDGAGAPLWDYFEIFFKWPDWYPFVGYGYLPSKALGFIMKKDEWMYTAYCNGGNKLVYKEGSSDSKTQDLIRFHNINAADCTWPDPKPTNPIGCSSPSYAHFDNTRVIFQNGYFASTPFYAGQNNVTWGTISWTAPSVDDTSIKMYVRAGTTLPAADTFSTQVNSGGQLSAFTGSRIQFKTELSSSAFNTGDYEASSVTPVLKDVTITYLPRVEVLYRRNEIN